MVILLTENLSLDHVADSANLDWVMKSVFSDAILLKVSYVSHDLMEYFHGSLVKQDNREYKNHQNIHFV